MRGLAKPVKPLVWDGLVSGCYLIEVEKGGIANLWYYSAEMVEAEEPELIKGGYLTLVSIDELKAIAEEHNTARIIAALDPEALARWREEAVQAERQAIADLIERIFAASDGVELRLSRNSEFITLTEIVAAIRAGKGGHELGKKLAEWVLRK